MEPHSTGLVEHSLPADCSLRTGKGALHHLNATMLGPFVREGTPFAGPLFPRLWPPDPDFPMTLEKNYRYGPR